METSRVFVSTNSVRYLRTMYFANSSCPLELHHATLCSGNVRWQGSYINNVPHGRAAHPGEPLTFAKTYEHHNYFATQQYKVESYCTPQYMNLLYSTLRISLARSRIVPCLTTRAAVS